MFTVNVLCLYAAGQVVPRRAYETSHFSAQEVIQRVSKPSPNFGVNTHWITSWAGKWLVSHALLRTACPSAYEHRTLTCKTLKVEFIKQNKSWSPKYVCLCIFQRSWRWDYSNVANRYPRHMIFADSLVHPEIRRSQKKWSEKLLNCLQKKVASKVWKCSYQIGFGRNQLFDIQSGKMIFTLARFDIRVF